MSDEHIIDDPPIDDATQSSDDWVMPKPVFRTSDGYTPKAAENPFYTDDIPTEIANRDESEFAKPQSDVSEENSHAGGEEVHTAEIVEKGSDTKPKQGGGRSFFLVASLIGVAAVAIIIALIYLLFYYSPAETGTF